MINKTIDFPLFISRMPSPQFRNSGIIAFLKQTPMFWSVLVTMAMIHTVKNIVSEKEAGIKVHFCITIAQSDFLLF